MTKQPKTPSSASKLEKALKKFERSIGSPKTLKKELVIYHRQRMLHPGLFRVSDIYLRIYMLKQFLKGAERPITDNDIPRLSSFILSLYDNSGSAPHNPMLRVEEEYEVPIFLDLSSYKKYAEQLEQEPRVLIGFMDKMTEIDLKKNAPGVTLSMIKKWEEDIKILEAKRMGILATITLLGQTPQNTPRDDKTRADMMLRLKRFWSGFRKSFYEITQSEAFGDMSFALQEVGRTVDRLGSKLKLNDLPKLLFLRFIDYEQGRSGSKFKKRAHPSIDEIDESLFDLLPKHMELDIKDLYMAMEKLSPLEQKALVEDFKGAKLNPAQRKAKSRAVKSLKKILQK